MVNQYSEVIRMYNDETSEILEKGFETAEEADDYEIHLSFLQVHYRRYSKGRFMYEESWG